MSFLTSAVDSNNNNTSYFNKAAFIILILGTLVLPSFFFYGPQDVINTPKLFLIFGLDLLLVLLFLLDIVSTKKVKLRRTFLDIPVLFFLILSLISALFSVIPTRSFLGEMSNYVLNFSSLFIFISWAWFTVQLISTPKRWQIITESLLVSSSIAGLVFIFHKASFLQTFFESDFLNTVSGSNALFGVFIGSITILALGEIMLKREKIYKNILPVISAVIGLGSLIRLDFLNVWLLFGLGLAFLVVLGVVMLKQTHSGIISVIFAIFVGVVLITFLGVPQSLSMQLPPEVSLNASTSWEITSKAILSDSKHFLIGSGPGTFVQDFSKFRPESFNLNSLAWSQRFSKPFSSIFAILAEFGVVGLVSFLSIFLIGLGGVIRGFTKVKTSLWGKVKQEAQEILGEDKHFLKVKSLVLAVGWLVITVGLGLFYFNATLWWMWWSLLALAVVGLSANIPTFVKEKKYSLEVSPQYSLALSFGGITAATLVIVLGVFASNILFADIYFNQAVSANTIEKKQQKINQALEYRSSYVPYKIAKSRLFLQKAQNLAKQQNPSQEQLANYLAQAVNITKKSTEQRPNEVDTWETLADMYKNARQFVPGANDWVEKSLKKAIELEPTNPVLHWELGNAYLFADKKKQAKDQYKQAIQLKPNYLIAYISLSKVLASEKKFDQAIALYQPIYSQIEKSPQALFNLARLFYNRGGEGDLKRAQQVLQQAITQSPNYVNALYTLGLVYQKQDKTQQAQKYFDKVKQLTSKPLDRKKQQIEKFQQTNKNEE
jgi:tetratricopeptide (TPR) repeat protein